MMEDSFRWISSNGGPLILLSEDLLEYWDGVDPPKSGRHIETKFRWNLDGPATDYDRACEISDYFGLLKVGPGYALILGEEPMPTTWWPKVETPTSGGYIVRWMFAANNKAVVRELEKLRDSIFSESEISLPVVSLPLVLFDSAFPGISESDVSNRLTINLLEGEYAISTAVYKPNSETSLLLHKFRWLTRNE